MNYCINIILYVPLFIIKRLAHNFLNGVWEKSILFGMDCAGGHSDLMWVPGKNVGPRTSPTDWTRPASKTHIDNLFISMTTMIPKTTSQIFYLHIPSHPRTPRTIWGLLRLSMASEGGWGRRPSNMTMPRWGHARTMPIFKPWTDLQKDG